MREIKFRGKTKKGKWVFGSYDDNWSSVGKYWIYVPGRKITGHEVVKESIGQYAFRKDKHGKDIFEGDILRNLSIGANCEVVFGCHSTMIDGFGEEELSPKFCVLWSDKSGYSGLRDTETEYEVIGNIYDNPELLTTK